MTKTTIKPVEQHAIDAITLLTEDHKKIKKLFYGFHQTRQGTCKEEEGEMFPKAMKAKLNTTTLGEALANRMHELQATMDKDRKVKAKKTASR